MSSSEDYLDSLLESALQQNDETIDMSIWDDEDSSSSKKNSDVFSVQNDSAKKDVVTISEALQASKKENIASSSGNNIKSIKDELKENALTPDEIDSKSDELIDLLKGDNSFFEDDDDDLEDIEAMLKAAEEKGMNEAAKAGLMGLTLSEEAMDITDYVDKKKISNAEADEISELLKKSDEGRLVDSSSLIKDIDPFQMNDGFDDESNSNINKSKNKSGQQEEADLFEENKSEDDENNKKGKKNKKTKNKKQKNKKKNDADEDGESSANKKNKGLFWFLKKNKKNSDEDKTNSEFPDNSDEMNLEEHLSKNNNFANVDQNAENEAFIDNLLNFDNTTNSLDDNKAVNNQDDFFADDLRSDLNASDDNLLANNQNNNQDNNEQNSNENGNTGSAFNEDQSSENGSLDDFLGMDIMGTDDISGGSLENGEEDSKGKKKKKKKKDKESGEKKGNIFTRLFEALTEEVEEEENLVPEQNETKLSEENFVVLRSLEGDDGEASGKKKKEKKEKKKKEKKPKKVKPKKAKKEKAINPKEENAKKIPKKYIIRTFILAVSIFIVLILVCSYLPELLVVKEGRDAYYQKDYKNAFLSLYGKDLNESDQLIYERSKLIILLDRKYESYENYKALAMPKEALNSLLEGLRRYTQMEAKGSELGIQNELSEIRVKLVNALLGDYRLSEAEALEILEYSDLDYSNRIDSIVDGTPFRKAEEEVRENYGLPQIGANDFSGDALYNNDGVAGDEIQYPDMLPEEEAYYQQENLGMDDAMAENQTQQNSNQSDSGNNQNIGTTSSATSNNGSQINIEIESDLFQ